MSVGVIKLGNPPFPVKVCEDGKLIAKIEHLWQSVRRWAKANDYEYTSSYGVIGIGAT